MYSYAHPTKLYVQITLNCNQRCAHCGYDCGPEHREFMSIKVFKAALRLDQQACLNLTGGEPTCHPRFWEFMHEALSTRKSIWVPTNGKRKDHALRLAALAVEGKIRARLSIDRFHEPVDPEVVMAFRGLPGQARYGMRVPIRSGRWNAPVVGYDDCNVCSAIFVQWDGKIRQCGCLDAPIIGDVFEGYKPMFEGDMAYTCAFGKRDPNRR